MVYKLCNTGLPAAPGNVMGCKTASGDDLVFNIFKIIGVPAFIGIAKNKINWPFQPGHQFMGIFEAGIDIILQPGFPEIFQGFPVTGFVDLYGDQLSTCFA